MLEHGFSPLLDGDGVASLAQGHEVLERGAVSVPFSMGTVLHQLERNRHNHRYACFSPLLDGDGVASRIKVSVTGL